MPGWKKIEHNCFERSVFPKNLCSERCIHLLSFVQLHYERILLSCLSYRARGMCGSEMLGNKSQCKKVNPKVRWFIVTDNKRIKTTICWKESRIFQTILHAVPTSNLPSKAMEALHSSFILAGQKYSLWFRQHGKFLKRDYGKDCWSHQRSKKAN